MLILSMLAVPGYDLLPARTLQLIPGSNSITLFKDNSGKTSADWIDRDSFSFQCTYTNNAATQYCGLDVNLGEDRSNGIDLSQYQTIHLQMSYTGEAKVLRLYVRHAMRDTPVKTENTVYKYNNVLLPVNDVSKELEIKLSQLFVAEWWLRTARLPWKYSYPDVSNATNIGIDPPTPTAFGNHNFTISKLNLTGDYISRENWYLCIMGIWFIYLIIQVISRFVVLRQQVIINRNNFMYAQNRAKHFEKESIHHKEMSLIDPLTKIYNRRGITHACENQLNLTNHPSCAVMLDIDFFKKINDNFGHDVGDHILRKIGKILHESSRITDLVGRWGGEEFLILCSNTSIDQALRLTEHLRKEITAHCNIPDGTPVTASFGIAEIVQGDIETAVHQADVALYSAKEEGRNCSRIFSDKNTHKSISP